MSSSVLLEHLHKYTQANKYKNKALTEELKEIQKYFSRFIKPGNMIQKKVRGIEIQVMDQGLVSAYKKCSTWDQTKESDIGHRRRGLSIPH